MEAGEEMSKLMPVSDNKGQSTTGYAFLCPGCNELHRVTITPGRWTFNGNSESPTFNPSVLVRGRKMTPKGEADHQAWLDAGCPGLGDGRSFDSVETRCHSFVCDGRIQFLSDCTHDLAGKTVDLPDVENCEEA